LLQLHNVSNPRQSLAQFHEWKAQGICRYTGITSTFHGDFAAVEAILKREKPDFVQIDYSIDDRDVEKRILPLAADVQAGVLTAQPLGRGQLFRLVRGQALPDWAKDFANSWAQDYLLDVAATSVPLAGVSRHGQRKAPERSADSDRFG
jgi:aryl-alcohol dehydrogenase-like predicted oxidoreductase